MAGLLDRVTAVGRAAVPASARKLSANTQRLTRVEESVSNLKPPIGKIEDVVKRLAEMRDVVDGLGDHVTQGLSTVPGVLAKWAKDSSDGVWELGHSLKDAVGPMEDSVATASSYLIGVHDELAAFTEAPADGSRESHSQVFRQDLHKFFEDTVTIGTEVGRILFDQEVEVDLDLLKTTVDAAPDMAIYGLYQVLDPIPLWRHAPPELADSLAVIPSLIEIHQVTGEALCQLVVGTESNGDLSEKAIRRDLVRTNLTTTTILNSTFDLAQSSLPRDLVVNVTFVGGAGATVMSHPAHLVPSWIKWIFDMAGIAFTWYLALYDRCEAARAERQLDIWQRDVTRQLAEIRAALITH